jgi:hypothetical protein
LLSAILQKYFQHRGYNTRNSKKGKFARSFAMGAAFRYTPRYILIGLVAVLAACGGGGDSGNSGGSSGPSFQVSPSSITFIAPDSNSSAPAPQIINLNVTSGVVVLGAATHTGAVISNLNQLITGNTTAQITVYPSLPSNLGKGTHTGTVEIHACADASCANELPGSPRTVNVTYQVEGFSASHASINLSATEGETPVAVAVDVSHSTGSHAWTTAAAYDGATTGWATFPASGTSLPATLNVGASPLDAGIYTAALQLSITGNNLLLPVTYNVVKALAPSPVSLTYSVGTTVAPANLSGTLSVGTNYVVPKNINWNAATDVTWLQVSPSSGSTNSNDSLTAMLAQAQVDQLVNGTYTGNIILSSAQPQVSDVSVPVSLTVDRAQLNYVSPYVAVANSSAEVILRGRKFNEVSVQNVTFGGVPASAFTVVSDSEIRATHPALAAGTYPVVVVTSGGNLGSLANLVVTTPTTMPNLTFQHADVYKGILHDPERNTLLVFPWGGNYIERHVYNGASWASSSVTLPYAIYGAGQFSPDGKEIVIGTQDDRLMRLDAASLNVLSATAPLTVYPSGLESLAVLNDGNVLVASGTSFATELTLFNLKTQTFTSLTNGNLDKGLASISVPPDGSRAVLKFQDESLHVFDAGTGQLTAVAGALVGGNAKYSRNGGRIVSNNSHIYDASFNLLGQLPYDNASPNGCFTSQAVISPDGTRAYTYCSSRIYTYDLTVATLGGYFPAIGSYLNVVQWMNFLSVSFDGKTLFLNDSKEVRIVPLP